MTIRSRIAAAAEVLGHRALTADAMAEQLAAHTYVRQTYADGRDHSIGCTCNIDLTWTHLRYQQKHAATEIIQALAQRARDSTDPEPEFCTDPICYCRNVGW